MKKTWVDFKLDFPESFTGERYSTCPVCSGARRKHGAKCLSANGDTLKFLCHHCGYAGDFERGVTHKGGNGAPVEKKYVRPCYDLGPKVLTPATLKYFASRGISEATLVANHIGIETVYFPQTEDLRPAIRFPFLRNGEVVNVKSGTADKMFRLEKNAERIFYGLDDVTGDTAIIVEGEMDKLALYEVGIKHCVSVPDGAPSPNTRNYESKFGFLENCSDFIDGIKTFVLAVDNDEPGRKLEEELARRLGKHRCGKVTWPEGCKDANDVLVKCGADELRRVIHEARDYPVEGIFDVDDIWESVERLYDHGLQRGKSTGWPAMDEFYTVREGELTIVTGIPSHGKSEWLDALIVNLAKTNHWGFGIFSPENQPLALHAAKIMEKFSERPFYKTHEVWTDEGEIVYPRITVEELLIGRAVLKMYFTFILPPEDQLSVDSILELCRHVVLKKGIKGVIIDPWNELDHSRPGHMTETEYISYCLSKIRRFARHYNVHVWLVAHPTKLQKNSAGSYDPPTPYDISGSAHWRNKADNCITVFRIMGTPDVDIHVQKVRFKEVGEVGKVTLRYDRVTGVYS
jgi:twinkle protein